MGMSTPSYVARAQFGLSTDEKILMSSSLATLAMLIIQREDNASDAPVSVRVEPEVSSSAVTTVRACR